ncbi:MAG: glycosyltransferase, partial [Deltaproteobacteria bacterium]|nr:glycosyltransferase [Deltaproteobacteria bacterium]
TVSELERGVITSYLGDPGKVVGISNGVDLERFEFLPKGRAQGQMLFLAGMDYIPNIDSAHYFLQEIFPLIRSKMPEVRLEIVGKELWKIHDQPSFKGARFHQNVPDVLPWFRSSDLLVVPLRYGAGTRIKILEAMAAGLPVVTTSKGCEGIDVRHGEHLMIADSPAEFAAAVGTLIESEALRKSLIRNARRLVEERYSWQGLVNRMQAEFQNLRGRQE